MIFNVESLTFGIYYYLVMEYITFRNAKVVCQNIEDRYHCIPEPHYLVNTFTYPIIPRDMAVHPGLKTLHSITSGHTISRYEY